MDPIREQIFRSREPGVAYRLIPDRHNLKSSKTSRALGFKIEDGEVSKPVIRAPGYMNGNVGEAVIIGDTFGIPVLLKLDVKGDKREFVRRLRHHMSYIAQNLANGS